MSSVSLVVGLGSPVSRSIVERLTANGPVGYVADPAGVMQELPATTHAAGVSLDDPSAVIGALTDLRRFLGPFGAVVVVAGDSQNTATDGVGGHDLSTWAACVDLTLTLTYLVARETVDDLVAAKGSFTVVTSTAAHRGVHGRAAYAAASHGIIGLVKSMALDHARDGARYNVVSAGYVPGGQHARSFGVAEATIDRIPARRSATPRDVAHLVDHVSSKRSSYATGAVFTVDGGLSSGLLKEAEA